ncbi:MAG: AMP-binding protein [Parvularculaceae bacterium]|nr:AMP-binding protein [Parvularculaceae bacterium]
MTEQNFFATLKSAFTPALDRPFLTLPSGDSRTYREIDRLSAQIAGALRALGARRGDRIAVQVEKSPENVALYLAALRAGLVYLPLNTAYTPEEIAYFIADAEPAIFVCDPARNDSSPRGPKVLTLGADGAGTLIDSAQNAPPLDGVAPCHDDDLAVILYTSGTTGRSKGAMLTHRNLRSNAQTLHKLWGFQPGDVLLHALPIFHIHGLFVALHTAMLNASEVLFLPKFDVADVRAAMARASVMMGVPTFYTRLLAAPEFTRADCENMRLFISGSAPLTAETFKEFEQRTGMKILERYGMSEAGMIASNPPGGARLAGTVGYALPGVEVRITDNGETLPAGAPGAVEVRGANVFAGYWRMPEKTAEEFRDGGWFTTGDVGFLSEDGRLTLSGRAKDLVIVGGYNVYPKEIEEILDAVPGVGESAVIGVPHPDMGEGVIAVLAPDPGAARPDDAALASAVSALARFKQPRKFVFVDALPRNAMGKVQKQALRERFADSFTRQAD